MRMVESSWVCTPDAPMTDHASHPLTVKTLHLIERLPTTSRDDLVAFWINSHMPNIMSAKLSKRGHFLSAYVVSLIEQPAGGSTLPASYRLDGIAALGADRNITTKKRR